MDACTIRAIMRAYSLLADALITSIDLLDQYGETEQISAIRQAANDAEALMNEAAL